MGGAWVALGSEPKISSLFPDLERELSNGRGGFMIRATLRRSIVLAIVLSMAATAVSTVAATAQTGDVDVTVRARGATGTEQMQVRLGNSVVAEFTASTNWEEIDLEIDGPASFDDLSVGCLLYTSPSPRDRQKSRMPSSA